MTTRRYPVAYLRRSSADAGSPGDVSHEVQEKAIRDLAARDGFDGELRIFTDWDRSADESKEGRRVGFNAMIAAVEAGEVSAVYSYALDRLYRSIRTFVRLTDAAKKHDVRIVTSREGVLGGDGSPMAQAFAEITAVFSQLELRTAKARAAGVTEHRRRRGDHIGPAGYGFRLAKDETGRVIQVPDPDRPLEPLFAAVREAGSIMGACKLLNARGVPVPHGPSRERRHETTFWYPTPLRKIIKRNAPELLPPEGPSGRRQPSPSSRFAQLLVCHCGATLTPEPGRGAYRCARGLRKGAAEHGRLFVAEHTLLPWMKEEAARLHIPSEDGSPTPSPEARREAIEAAFLARPIAEYDEARRERDEALRALEGEPTLVSVPVEIDWDRDPVAVNAAVRALWRSVRLDREMRPVAADWIIPEWRRP